MSSEEVPKFASIDDYLAAEDRSLIQSESSMVG
jgi:hypothetical protein